MTIRIFACWLLLAVAPLPGAWAGQAPDAAAAQAPRSITGVVRDSAGGTVSGAAVLAMQGARTLRQTISDPDGQFALSVPAAGDVVLVVRAGGFAESRTPLAATPDAIDVVVTPAGLLETVIVTATRTEQRLGSVPASVSVLSRADIQNSPAVVADDVLRQVPTFSLFRRASSLVAQPTTQGVSLRGIGPSGQSRTLVLLDGVPFNDPFGGWVYWTRVPLLSVDRIEVAESPGSSLYGNYAMGGVINIVTAPASRRTLELKPQYGSRRSPKVDFFASDRWKNLGVAVEGNGFNSDGFPIVAATERGPVDNNAQVNYRNLSAKLDYTPSDRVSAFMRAAYFTEDRVNGKVGEVNDTKLTTANGGVRLRMRNGSDLQARLFLDRERSHFNFLAVTNAATTRNLVRLATDQRVPTNGLGSAIQWSRPVGRSHVFSTGGDWRRVAGESREDAYVPTAPAVINPPTQQATLSVQRVSGGAQQSLGAFAQDVFTPVAKVVVTLSARVDYWRNYNGRNLETTVATGLPTVNHRPTLPDRRDTVVSPRVAALYHVTDRVTAWGSVNSGFRAPTLTELYRQFSVGAVTTRPNNQLGPERLKGGELGLNVAPASNLTARVTWFDNRITNPVSNVTLNATTAQKQNLGATRVWGVQSDVEYRPGTAWRLSAAYIYDHARVTDGGAANAALVGKFLAQVPTHRGSMQVAYTNPRVVNVAVSVQASGRQFNDDLNVNFIPAATLTSVGYSASAGLGLPGYATVDLSASRDLGPGLQVFVGAQNLFNRTYFVQTNPSTIGTPRLVNGGVRIRLSGK